MLDSMATVLAIRTRLLGTDFATTGATTLTATGNGYTRVAGDFLADGFVPGFEVTPSGFSNNEVEVIKSVTALQMVIQGAHPSEASGSGRTLTATVPEFIEWENRQSKADEGRPFFVEEFIPSPQYKETVGPLGWVTQQPIYLLKIFGIPNIGISALYRMADAILLRFPPLYAMTLVDGTVLRVRSNTGPHRGQVMQDHEVGAPFIQVTIPFWVRTQNPI